MSDLSKDEIVLEDTAPQAAACEEPATDGTAPADALRSEAEVPSPAEGSCAEKQSDAPSELQELGEKYLRLAAEYDNFRKRTAREREQQTDFVVADTVARFLPVVDSLHLADVNRGGNAEDVQLGLDKILQSMTDTLSALGLTEIDTGGEFDPNLHNAILHVEDESLPPNSIVEVFQRGYLYRDRVVRHAIVSVAN